MYMYNKPCHRLSKTLAQIHVKLSIVLNYLLRCQHHLDVSHLHYHLTRITILLRGDWNFTSWLSNIVSELYARQSSHKQETKDCGIRNLLEPEDDILA
jgi:hypothetical protein